MFLLQKDKKTRDYVLYNNTKLHDSTPSKNIKQEHRFLWTQGR